MHSSFAANSRLPKGEDDAYLAVIKSEMLDGPRFRPISGVVAGMRWKSAPLSVRLEEPLADYSARVSKNDMQDCGFLLQRTKMFCTATKDLIGSMDFLL